MAPSHSFILLLSLVLSPFVQAAPWIVTDTYEQEVNTDYYSELVTEINQISPTATLPVEALSTITSTNTNYDYTVVEKLYPTGYGEERDPYDGYRNVMDSDGTYHTTIYKVNLTFSAPTACSTQWTTTTAATVRPPYAIATLLPRDNVVTSTSIDNSQPFEPTTYIYEVVFVEPTQIPSRTLNSLSLYNTPTSRYIGSGCQYTGVTSDYSGNSGYYTGLSDGSSNSDGTSSSGSGYYDYGYDDDDNWFTSTWGSGLGISYLAIVLICGLGWIGVVFILGMIEAWVRFRRLMTGWQTRRGFPLFWSFILLPLSLFCLFCFRKGYRARSKEDAAILQKRWDAMGFWTKMRLFFAWGFRFKYPTVLGPAPATVKANKRPVESGPRLLDVTPPGTNAPSRAASTEGAPGAGPEMNQVPASQIQPQPHPSSQTSGVLTVGRDEESGPVRYA